MFVNNIPIFTNLLILSSATFNMLFCFYFKYFNSLEFFIHLFILQNELKIFPLFVCLLPFEITNRPYFFTTYLLLLIQNGFYSFTRFFYIIYVYFWSICSLLLIYVPILDLIPNFGLSELLLFFKILIFSLRIFFTKLVL